MYKTTLKLCILVAAIELVVSVDLRTSAECSDVFNQDSSNIPGQKNGILTLFSDYDLHGVWIRLIFDDSKFTLTTNLTGLEVVKTENASDVLVKDRHFLLTANTPVYVKIELKYDGNKVPNLIEYRLNAKTVCPSEDNKIFKGDQDKNFLKEILHRTKTSTITKPTYKCGEMTPESDTNSVPWHTAIYILQNNKEYYTCEGTLITDKHILTAAHCVSYIGQKVEAIEPKQLRIRLAQDSKLYNVKKIILHPGFTIAGLLNDIAIIELDSTLEISSTVKPICLPPLDQHQDDKAEKRILWGYDISNESINTNKLTSVELEEIRSLSKCESRPNFADLSHLLRVSDNAHCAIFKPTGSPATKSCAGDSGAAITSPANDNADSNKKVWTLNSIVTIGVVLQNQYECNDSSTILLLDIGNYLKWISSIIFL